MRGSDRVRGWWGIGLVLLMSACGGGQARKGEVRRVVSLSPSLTQMVFALGAGGRVRAVTKYDYRPPSVRNLPKVGGFLDIDLERLLAFRPDLVLLSEMHGQVAAGLRGARVEYLELRTRSIAEVLSAITVLSGRLGLGERGRELRRRLRNELHPMSCAVKPRVLITLGRDHGSLKNLVAAGRGTYLDELLVLAGGVNAIERGPASYPRLSREELVGLGPTVVVDLVQKGQTSAPWGGVPFRVPVRIEVLDDPTASSPGVHMGETLRRLHGLICPKKTSAQKAAKGGK